jgi:Cu(I)/Ag(I) efflux system membrane fusion protein
MHPQVTKDGPGDCQICGMHLVPREQTAVASKGDAGSVYLCPMHPAVTSPGPADCPICGMHLVAKPAPADVAGGGSSPDGLAPVEISTEKRAELGLTFGAVERRRFARAVRSPARIVPDETRIHRVISRVDGYVDKLYVWYSGKPVRKGEPLLAVQSLTLAGLQQQYLTTQGAEARRTTPSRPGQEGNETDEAAKQRLRYWNFSEEQIDRILKTGKPEGYLDLVSPSSGVVTEKAVVLGQRVAPGDLLFVVTDLSRVWAEVDVPEQDVPAIAAGMPLEIRIGALPAETFSGKVKFFQPVLDPATRTMKVYAEVQNPGLHLKPGMLGTAELRSEALERLAVEEGAVVHTGDWCYVFVEQGARLAPRTVVPGARGGGYVEVLSGLKEGERVATSATFLLDSESSLRAGLAAAAGQ